MIVVDANLLIYAVNADAPRHREAKRWLETTLTGGETVGMPWNVLLAFLRLTTRPGVFRAPLPVETALDVIDQWLSEPAVIAVEPTARHAHVLRELLLEAGTGGNLTSDAHLAALAIEHGAELCSTDSDFARFPRLRWRNPLV
jgi:uncharacterized protein